MTDDDTNAAQKAIDDAAKSASPVAPPAVPSEPEPLPVVPPAPEPTPEKQPDLMPPAPTTPPSTTETGEKLMSDLLEPTTVAAVPEHKSSEKPLAPSGGMKKKSAKGGILIVIATLLLTLPVAVFFLSKQNQQLNDLRSRATGNTYNGCRTGSTYECCINDPNTCPGQGGPNACHCQGGQDCTGTKCENIETNCRNDGRDWCDNSQGFGKTCCARGYVCCSNENGCCSGGGPTPPPDDNGDDTTSSTPTPTPTTGTTPVCQNIKLYKGGTQVTDLTTLRAGDDVVLTVKGNLNPTKAHFRVNGGAWTETATKNSGNEYTLAYTIPTGVTEFVIEGEVFTNGAWH